MQKTYRTHIEQLINLRISCELE